MKRKISISLDEEMYAKLLETAHENYGSGKMAVSAFTHFTLINAINRIRNRPEKQVFLRKGQGCVYIIQEKGKGYVKIGFAKDFQKRMEALETNNPHEIKVIAILYGCTMQDELNLHKKYGEYRVRREWYKSSVLNHLYKDIERLGTKNPMGKSVPTSSEHYLHLVEA
jgi:hypothetical protein